MTDKPDLKPPPRLADDPAIAPDVQEGLAQLASMDLPFDVATGLSSLQNAVGTAAAPAGSALSTGALVAGGVALVLAGAGLYAWLAPRATKPDMQQQASTAAATPKPTPTLPSVPAAVTEPVAPPPIIAKTDASTQDGQRSVERDTPLEREVALIVQAKALVHDKPRAALSLLRRLEREHPRGALTEERAGLRVLALWAAGEVERASAERSAFLDRYPQSPMRERLMQLQDAP